MVQSSISVPRKKNAFSYLCHPRKYPAGEAAIRALLASAQNPHVRAFYRDPSKAPAEFKENSRFTALQADVGSGSGIDFEGSDAVFYIPPPAMDGTDVEVFAKKSSDAIKSAIKASSTDKRLLVLSAIAAQNDHGIVRVISVVCLSACC